MSEDPFAALVILLLVVLAAIELAVVAATALAGFIAGRMAPNATGRFGALVGLIFGIVGVAVNVLLLVAGVDLLLDPLVTTALVHLAAIIATVLVVYRRDLRFSRSIALVLAAIVVAVLGALVLGLLLTGEFDAPGGPLPPDDALLWQYETDNPGELVTVSPNVANGVVYAGSQEGSVYALNAETGELLWRFDAGGGLNPPPTVAGRVVYAEALDNLYALDASTGELLSSDESVYEELLLSDGTLYFPTWRIDGDLSVHIRAVDAASGEELWRADVPRSSELPLLFQVTASGEMIFVSDDNQVHALDSATGELVWTYDAGDVVQDPPTASNGVVYLRSYSAAHAVDESTGEQLWSYEIEYGGLGDRPAYIVDGVWPLVEFDVLHGLDADRGRPFWSFEFEENQAPFVSGVADGMVFVTGSEAFHALDAATGGELWSLNADWGIGEVTVVDGVLYANSLDGYLHTLDARTGKPLWSVHIGYHRGGTTRPYTVWGGVVYVGYQLDGSGIYAFAAPGGR